MTKTESFLRRSPLYPALILESYFSRKKRNFLIKLTEYLLLAILLIIVASVIFSNLNIFASSGTIDFLSQKLIGVVFLVIGIYLLMQMFEFYFASVFYFDHIAKNNYTAADLYTFSAGRILRKVNNDNLLTGLLQSHSLGLKIMHRLGITETEINLLLAEQAEVRNPPLFNFEQTPLVKVMDLVDFIYTNHSDFKTLLTSHGISQNDLAATVEWMIYSIENKEYEREWWTKEKLAKIQGMAHDWSFGRTYLLNKFSQDLLLTEEVSTENISFARRERELEQIQTILARPSGANALLVGLPGQEKMEVVWNLCRKIKNQTVTPKLLGKLPLLFLTSDFSTSIANGNDFTKKSINILTEALGAGNIILVIDNLPKLILTAKQFNLNLYEIIEPYLASTSDQIIALADTDYFHTLIEPDQALMSRFEIIQTKPLLLSEIIKIIGREALTVENTYEVLYTYPAILEIAQSAENYFPNGVSADKAQDILTELSPWAVENGIETIGKEEVLRYVSEKTDIPISTISPEEKGKLLDLESLLMKRVVAQKEALFVIGSALRRSRAGIRNEKRPLGSFLFLGPTGVGKTETAKALADIYFGDEKLLLRLDMSEYQNREALGRLIGSQENNSQGILANLLREHPYGVLLLDEFEKTNPDVLNLFLQIIDEGYFSDVAGKKVMARNIMFIATSNAGAEKIFELVSTGKNLKKYETEIISDIVKQGVFKPELLNRFDATVLFHPLTRENLAEIAKLMLTKVAKRLGEKGMILSIDKELIDFAVAGGYNPSFGARPMNRLIQDTVEQHLADMIIRGQLTAGQTVSFKVIGTTADKDSLKPVVI